MGLDLVRLAETSAVTWSKGEAFAGVTTIETGNTLYRFQDGVFSGRAKKPREGAAPEWESPPAMTRVELVGFLRDEGGLWSLSPRWRRGALAVMTTSVKAFTLTSRTVACTIEQPPAVPRDAPESSDVFAVTTLRKPRVRRPPPLSLTRVQTMPLHVVRDAPLRD